MAARKLSPNGELVERIERFWTVNEKRKALEREEEALRDYFKDRSKGKACTWKHGDLTVDVTSESRVQIDNKALRLEYGDKIKKFEKRNTFLKVVVLKSPPDNVSG